jgi:hypothetical protein
LSTYQHIRIIMNRYSFTITIILTFTFSLFITVWTGDIYRSGEVVIDILGSNQSSFSSSTSSSSPLATMSMMERGDIAMGFNQNKITHNFRSTLTGGEIIITALAPNNAETIEQIKNHTLDIQNEFSKGNFTKPFFIHAEQVPGTKIMTDKKDLIKYSTDNIGNGSILVLDTRDDGVINAIHQFMNYQGSQHRGH